MRNAKKIKTIWNPNYCRGRGLAEVELIHQDQILVALFFKTDTLWRTKGAFFLSESDSLPAKSLKSFLACSTISYSWTHSCTMVCTPALLCHMCWVSPAWQRRCSSPCPPSLSLSRSSAGREVAMPELSPPSTACLRQRHCSQNNAVLLSRLPNLPPSSSPEQPKPQDHSHSAAPGPGIGFHQVHPYSHCAPCLSWLPFIQLLAAEITAPTAFYW